MTSPFDRALSSAAATHARVAGHAVVYRAGKYAIEIPDAVLGSTDYESVDENGAKLRSKVTDWLIMIPRLVYNSAAIEPTPGHRIEHTVSDTKRTYEVQTVGDAPCYRFSGPARDRYRIHVREIPNA